MACARAGICGAGSVGEPKAHGNRGKGRLPQLTGGDLSESISPIVAWPLQLAGKNMDSFLRTLTPFFGA